MGGVGSKDARVSLLPSHVAGIDISRSDVSRRRRFWIDEKRVLLNDRLRLRPEEGGVFGVVGTEHVL